MKMKWFIAALLLSTCFASKYLNEHEYEELFEIKVHNGQCLYSGSAGSEAWVSFGYMDPETYELIHMYPQIDFSNVIQERNLTLSFWGHFDYTDRGITCLRYYGGKPSVTQFEQCWNRSNIIFVEFRPAGGILGIDAWRLWTAKISHNDTIGNQQSFSQFNHNGNCYRNFLDKPGIFSRLIGSFCEFDYQGDDWSDIKIGKMY